MAHPSSRITNTANSTAARTSTTTSTSTTPSKSHAKPALNMDPSNPSSWLNFSLPPRAAVPGSGLPGGVGVPRRSRRGEGYRGGALSRERYVHANFRFVLKPSEVGSYGAHFADPDISLHWPHILQVLVPTFSATSVAQGYVSGDPHRAAAVGGEDEPEDDLGASLDEREMAGLGEEAARVRQRMEEERRGRMCPICLGRPVAGRMTKCGHIFCFPCILHYIRLSDIPGSAKCPICGDTVHEGMLKSVKYLDAASMIRSAVGEDVEREDDAGSTPSTGGWAGYSGSGPTSAGAAQDGDIGHAHEHGIVGHMDGFDDHDEHAADTTGGTGTNHVIDHHDADDTTRAGHRIHMRLIQRPQMTTLALPSSSTYPSEAIPPHTAPWYFLPDVLAFSRFMLATPSYMLSELSRELAELTREEGVQAGDELGREFVRAAKEKVERQVGKVRAELMTEVVERGEERTREVWREVLGRGRREGARREKEARERKEREEREEERKRLVAIAEQRRGDGAEVGEEGESIPTEFLASSVQGYHSSVPNAYASIPPNLPVEPNPMPHAANTTPSSSSSTKRQRRRNPPGSSAPPSTPPGQSYFYYQSSLGSTVFLHPLDIRILLSHYTSYALFPRSISFPSTGFDPGTITDELRKRCKYLSHLPLGTEVVFVEADLEALVGKAGLAPFEQALKARRAKRRQRTMKEDKAKSRAERLEREKNGTIGEGREEREFMSALQRSVVGNTIHGGVGIPVAPGTGLGGFAPVNGNGHGEGLGASLGSGSSWSPSDRTLVSPSTSPGTGTGTSGGIWAGTRPSFATALHSHSASSVPTPRRLPSRVASAAAAVRGDEGGREGTAEAEDEWQVQAVWDAAFSSMSLEGEERDRYGRRIGGGGGGGGRGRGTVSEGGAREGVGVDDSAAGGGGGGGGGKKGRNKGGRKVLVLGGGGPGSRR